MSFIDCDERQLLLKRRIDEDSPEGSESAISGLRSTILPSIHAILWLLNAAAHHECILLV
jgi:hypothetical protein